MIAFPTNIHYLDAATFMESSEDGGITPGKMEGGYVISRPRFTRRPRRSYMFNYDNMNDASKNALQAHWDAVFGTANAFTWVHPVSGQTINVRFGSDTKMVFQRIGFGPINIWKSEKLTLVEV